MPFSDIVKPSIVMFGLVKKPSEFRTNSMDVTNKRCECSLLMYRHFPNHKLVCAHVFGHKEPAHLTPVGFDQGPLDLARDTTWQDELEHWCAA